MRLVKLAPLALLAAAAPAAASPLAARLSPGGVEWVEEQIPTFIPNHLEPPPMTFEMWSCPGDNATFTQRNTVIDIYIDDFDLSLPQPGILRVDLTFSAWADGEAYLDNVYVCFGEETCQDSISIWGARAIADFSLSLDSAGNPRADLAAIDLQLSEDDIDVYVSDCPPDDIINTMVGLAKEYGLQKALEMSEDFAQSYVGPKLEEILAGFTTYEGQAGSAAFDARLTSINLATNGISLGADLDFTSQYPAAACLPSDPGDPGPHPGAAPDLASGVDAHVGAAFNLGLVEDALYHVWREGFLCVSPDVLASFGIDLDLSVVGDLLPGFPEGTTFTFQALLATPPEVRGSASSAAELTIALTDFNADLIARFPDGQTRTLHAEIDASVTATVALDPSINALAVQVGEVHLDRLLIEDEVGLSEIGFDSARIQQLLEDRILPRLAEELGSIPVTGPVFGGIQRTYAILREVRTTDAWMYAKADLFRAPEFDYGAPDTSIDDQPTRPVSPKNAKVLLGGSDAEIPMELLRYRVDVEGVSLAPTYVREVKFGHAGVTKTYRIAARAMDLAGNEDQTPAVADVVVDGVLPTLLVDEPLKGTYDVANPELRWTASDDLSPPSAISAHLKVFDISVTGSPKLAHEESIPAGISSTNLPLEPGVQYRAVLTIADEAGNEASEAMLFSISPDATGAPGSGCACQAAGSPSGGSAPIVPAVLLFACALILARRRS